MSKKKKVKKDLKEIGHNHLTLSQKIEITQKYSPDMDAAIYANWVKAVVQELLNEVPVYTQPMHNHFSAVATTVQSEEDEEDNLTLDFMDEIAEIFQPFYLLAAKIRRELSAADEKSKTTAKSEGDCSVAEVQSLLNGSIGSFEMKPVFGSTMKEQLGEALS